MVLRELLVIPIFRVSKNVFMIFVFRENVEDAWKWACSRLFGFPFSHFYGAAFFAFLDMVVHTYGHMDYGLDVCWALINLPFPHKWPCIGRRFFLFFKF